MSQDLRHSVIGEHGQFFLVSEVWQIFAAACLAAISVVIVCTDKVCDEYLGTFVEENLSTLVDSLVSEALKGINDSFDKLWTRCVRFYKREEGHTFGDKPLT